ncbi:class I SAM-dependent methyltransferase [bacterium]|nr:class I SAM-dependent methyltransferase [bacterium]
MIYDYPKYYEAAFSFRDIAAETAFIAHAIDRYSAVPVERVLEIACGPAPHAGELIRRGYAYTGMDINSTMLEYAGIAWKHLKPEPTFFKANMVRFDSRFKADFVFVMLGSLYLNSIEEMQSHFDSVASALTPGGLYFLDCCIQFSDMMVPVHSNRVVTGDRDISIQSAFDIRLIDPARQIYEEIWRVDVDDNGKHHTFEMVEHNKAIYPQEFLLFINQHPAFDFVGWWEDWDFNRPITVGCNPTRPLALIRRV